MLQFSWYDPQTLLDDDDLGPALDSPGLAELLREHLLEPDAARCF